MSPGLHCFWQNIFNNFYLFCFLILMPFPYFNLPLRLLLNLFNLTWMGLDIIGFMFSQLEVYWASWIYRFIVFIKVEGKLATISSIFFSVITWMLKYLILSFGHWGSFFLFFRIFSLCALVFMVSMFLSSLISSL